MARRFSRDNRGRFASGGTGATARGGRLKTASGNKRATQTTKAAAAKPSGAIAGKVKRNPAAAGKIGQQAKAVPPSAAKPRKTTKAAKNAALTDAKMSRIANRVDKITDRSRNNPSTVKRLNSIEVRQRAGNFLLKRPATASSANDILRQNIAGRKKYATQKPSRNKPGSYNNLGQATQRQRMRAATSLSNRSGNAFASSTADKIRATASKQTATTIASAPKPQRVSARATGTSAPNTPRTQANRLRTAQGAIRQLQRTGATPDSKAFRTAVQRRDAALGARAQGTPGKMTFRSRGKSVARQNYQANQVTGRVAANMRYAKPGDFKAQTGSANKTGIKRSDTGMRQSSLFGAPAKLYSAKKVKVDRKSGKRR